MSGLIDSVGSYVAFAAVLGILLLLPLYLSQHRDLVRLRVWMDRDPGHPPADILASERLLDLAEAELESLLAERGEPVTTATAGPPTTVAPAQEPAAPSAGEPASVEEAEQAPAEGPTPPPVPAATPTPTGLTPIPAARRVTSERPALTRITMERAALEAHPRWRRFGTWLTRPRNLALIALGAAIIAVVVLIGSRALLHNGTSAPRHHHHRAAGAVVPSRVTVGVLNGTSSPGLAATVGQTLSENGFREGGISTTRRQYQQTVVMYGPHEKKAAERVAHVLGVTPVQPIDRTTRAIAGARADVVVIAGADRTRQ